MKLCKGLTISHHKDILNNYTNWWTYSSTICSKHVLNLRTKLVECLLNTELGSKIRFSKRCGKLIGTSHPNALRSCRIVKGKPAMRPWFSSCSNNSIFNSKKHRWSQKKWWFTNSFWWVYGLVVWCILYYTQIKYKPVDFLQIYKDWFKICVIYTFNRETLNLKGTSLTDGIL